MLKSMTGYGKAEQVVEKKKITVELRSLNSKTLDINFKIPLHYREKENTLRVELTRTVQRGKLEVSVTVTEEEPGALATLNRALFLTYYTQLDALLQTVGSSAKEEHVSQAILRLPDVLDSLSFDVSDAEWQSLSDCLQQALADFDRFRIDEGRALGADILTHVACIEALLDEITVHEPTRIELLRQRMNANLETMLQPSGGYDKNRFEQELIYYLEKIDITEEKIRLRQHCRHFCRTIECEDAVGRKLGFIAQEMGREINTLGSKANHSDIQKLVVQMKDELEKIKEQLLNIL
jgi:uncharacterized protein (TIGR00255 family)